MTPTTYISIDVATRSLAIGVYHMKSFTQMDDYKSEDPLTMDENMNSIIQPILMNVFDINDGAKTKDTTAAFKAVALKKVLESVDSDIADAITGRDVVVVVEYQMNSNYVANSIFNMIVMFYAGRYSIEVIPPSWKNTICIHPELSHSKFLGYCSTNYSANKNHCKYSMLYLLTMIDRMDLIKDIKKSNHDDIADTLCQALARHMKQ
jgi:hypothetical protein